MTLHDEYARITPFEIAFSDSSALDRFTDDVREEASARAADTSSLESFQSLQTVASVSGEMQPPDADEAASQELATLLFHAFHFRAAERPVYLLQTPAARELIATVPEGEPAPPTTSGYLQMPQHLFWMGSGVDGVPESIDGVSWFASTSGTLHLLPITGVLPDQFAFRALPIPAAPLHHASAWMKEEVRGANQDFTSDLPGKELDRLHAMERAGEVFKFMARFFAYLLSSPDACRTSEPVGEAAADRPNGPTASSLPFTVVSAQG